MLKARPFRFHRVSLFLYLFLCFFIYLIYGHHPPPEIRNLFSTFKLYFFLYFAYEFISESGAYKHSTGNICLQTQTVDGMFIAKIDILHRNLCIQSHQFYCFLKFAKKGRMPPEHICTAEYPSPGRKIAHNCYIIVILPYMGQEG